jgi:hypothetical protein
MKALRLPFITALFVLLAACAGTFDQRLQDGYDLNVSVRDAATLSLNAGRITSAQGTEVLEITDSARKLLDTAANGDERGLNLALEVLQAIEKETP